MDQQDQMQKLLISALCGASLALAACSSTRLPGAHKIDVQQGNLVTQEMVDQLKPGMSKRQVTFVMGTPMISDVFHADRWDYVYTMQPGGGQIEQRHVTLYFAEDALTRVEGDYQPRPNAAESAAPKETVVTVTPPPADKGFFSRLWRSATARHRVETTQPPPAK